MSTPLHMWSYYRAKYCTIAGCIHEQYADTLGKDLTIRAALMAIANAERMIGARVAELAANEPDPNE